MTLHNFESEPKDSFITKRASLEDLPAVWYVIDKCSQWLSDNGFHHWAKYYNEGMVSKMIQKKRVYMGIENGRTIGTVTFDTRAPKYYAETGYAQQFTDPNAPAAYVTGIAVLPTEQNHGYAGRMLAFVEQEAKKENAQWLRLDCRAEIPGLVSFYEKRGYTKVGDTPFDEGDDGMYWLMEKKL